MDPLTSGKIDGRMDRLVGRWTDTADTAPDQPTDGAFSLHPSFFGIRELAFVPLRSTRFDTKEQPLLFCPGTRFENLIRPDSETILSWLRRSYAGSRWLVPIESRLKVAQSPILDLSPDFVLDNALQPASQYKILYSHFPARSDCATLAQAPMVVKIHA